MDPLAVVCREVNRGGIPLSEAPQLILDDGNEVVPVALVDVLTRKRKTNIGGEKI